MRLISFQIENYRSITTKAIIETDDLTVLVGPNNKGKSNVLRAFVLGLSILSRIEDTENFKISQLRPEESLYAYKWERDFPIDLQTEVKKKVREIERKEKAKGVERGEDKALEEERQKIKKTVFLYQFDLDAKDEEEIGKKTNASLKKYFGVSLEWDHEGQFKFQFRKSGPQSQEITKKRDEICEFIRSKIAFEYISTARDAKSAHSISNEVIEADLQKVQAKASFKTALEALIATQAAALAPLEKNLTDTLKALLPAIEEVRLRIDYDQVYKALRSAHAVRVNDGIETDLSFKGDGVQSLASLALIRHASEASAGGRHLILAIEEPETHLHPDAIHKLKALLSEISEKHQVLLTTHNPILINRSSMEANVIVQDHKAEKAQGLGQIRDLLGIHLGDNLQSAELVLMLEGSEDEKPVKALLEHHSSVIKEAIESGRLAIDLLHGAGNLSQKLDLFDTFGCACHVFIDYDNAGRTAVDAAVKSGRLIAGQVTYAQAKRMTESEIEDLYAVPIYKTAIEGQFGITIDTNKRARSKVWSDWMKSLWKPGIVPYTAATEMHLKSIVSEAVTANPASALDPDTSGCFGVLIEVLEGKLKGERPM